MMAYDRLMVNDLENDLGYIDSDGDSFDGVPLQTLSFARCTQSGYAPLGNKCDDDVDDTNRDVRNEKRHSDGFQPEKTSKNGIIAAATFSNGLLVSR